MKIITMYTGPMCNFCDAAKRAPLPDTPMFTPASAETDPNENIAIKRPINVFFIFILLIVCY